MNQITVFTAASLVVIATPGPDMVFVLVRSLSGGLKKGVVSALGVSSALMVHGTASALGTALLIQSFPHVQSFMKGAGGIYLIWLGYKTISSSKKKINREEQKNEAMGKTYIQGFISNILNPKIIIFFTAFLPQFVDLNSGGYRIRLIILGTLFALMTFVFFVTIAALVGNAGKLAKRKRNIEEPIAKLSGTVLISLGLFFLIPLAATLS